MINHPNRSKRVCCVCGHRTRRAPDGSTESTLGFRTALRAVGIEGDKAHPSCLREAQQKFEASR